MSQIIGGISLRSSEIGNSLPVNNYLQGRSAYEADPIADAHLRRDSVKTVLSKNMTENAKVAGSVNSVDKYAKKASSVDAETNDFSLLKKMDETGRVEAMTQAAVSVGARKKRSLYDQDDKVSFSDEFLEDMLFGGDDSSGFGLNMEALMENCGVNV